MREILTRLYLKIYECFVEILSFVKLVRFTMFLHTNHVIRNGIPKDVLKVVDAYLKEASANYTPSIKMNRSVEESTALLGTLIYVYMETGSEVILNQILKVLVTEFIERGNNGNK